jgi:hypothetical protein
VEVVGKCAGGMENVKKVISWKRERMKKRRMKRRIRILLLHHVGFLLGLFFSNHGRLHRVIFHKTQHFRIPSMRTS